jgi:acylphosphatase
VFAGLPQWKKRKLGLSLFGSRCRMQDDPVTVIRHVMIRGRVQGVGYRAWTEHEALRRGLQGWARNRRDGSVEAVFAGQAEIVAAMIEACRRGPPGARVEAVDIRDGGASDFALRREGERFTVLPTW